MKKLFLFILICSFVFIPFAYAEEELPLAEDINEMEYQSVVEESQNILVENQDALVENQEDFADEEETGIKFGLGDVEYNPVVVEEFKELETQVKTINRSSRSSIFSSTETSSKFAIMILVVFASFVLTSAAIYQFVLKKEI